MISQFQQMPREEGMGGKCINFTFIRSMCMRFTKIINYLFADYIKCLTVAFHVFLYTNGSVVYCKGRENMQLLLNRIIEWIKICRELLSFSPLKAASVGILKPRVAIYKDKCRSIDKPRCDLNSDFLFMRLNSSAIALKCLFIARHSHFFLCDND